MYAELDDDLLRYIRQNPSKARSEIKEAFEADKGVDKNTTNNHLVELLKKKLIIEGVFVTNLWKKQKIKSYILITTNYCGEKGQGRWAGGDDGPSGRLTYQQVLVRDIRKAIEDGIYRGTLFLESVEIVLGAEFDIILILLADDVYPIGDFVTGFLRTQRDVHNTKTIMVWPSRSNVITPESDYEP